jgi:hypothetical protein
MQRIKEEITTIPEQMTCRVMESHWGRFEQCLCDGWGHLSEVLFKK